MMNSTSKVGRTARLFQFNLLAFVLAVAACLGSPNLAAQGCMTANSITFGASPMNAVITIEGADDPCLATADGNDEYSVFATNMGGNIDLNVADVSIVYPSTSTYRPSAGDQFTIIQADGMRIDTFAQGDRVTDSDGAEFSIVYNMQTVVLTRSPIFLTDDVVGVCAGEDEIEVSLSNFPISAMDVDYNISLLIEDAINPNNGLASFALNVTVLAGETSISTTFAEPGVGTDPDYEGGTIMISSVAPSAGGANLAIDPMDVATIDVRENPVGTFEVTTAVVTGPANPPMAGPAQVCPGEDVEITFTATAGAGPFNLTFEIIDNGQTATPTTTAFMAMGVADMGTFTLTEGTDFNGDINSIELTNIEDTNSGLVNCNTASGNTETGSPLILATDDVLPTTADCPVGFNVCQGDDIVFTAPTFTDNCDPTVPTVQTVGMASPVSTDQNTALGDMTFTFTGTDDDGNVGTCTFVVNVDDSPDFAVTSDANPKTGGNTTCTGSNNAQFEACSNETFNVIVEDTDLDPANTTYTLTTSVERLFGNGNAMDTLVTRNGEFVAGTTKANADANASNEIEFEGSIENFQASNTSVRVTFNITAVTTFDAGLPTERTCTRTNSVCVAVYAEVRIASISTDYPSDVCDDELVGSRTVTRNNPSGDQRGNFELIGDNPDVSGTFSSNNTSMHTTGFTSGGTITIPSFTAVNTGNTPDTLRLVASITRRNNNTALCTGRDTTFKIVVNPEPAIALNINSTTNGGAIASSANTTNGVTPPTVIVCDSDDNVAATFVLTPNPLAGLNTNGDSTRFNITFVDNNVITGVPTSGNAVLPADQINLDSTGVADFFNIADFRLQSTATANGSVEVTITPYYDTDGSTSITAGDCVGDAAVFNVTIQASPDITAAPIADDVLCSGETAMIGVTIVPNDPQTTRFNYSSNGLAGSDANGMIGQMPEPTMAITEMLTNTTDDTLAVIYTITPYTFGPDDTDNGGALGSDDCVGPDTMVTVVVEPVPTLDTVSTDTTITLCDNVSFQDTLLSNTAPTTGRVVLFEVDPATLTNGTGTVSFSGMSVSGNFISANEPFMVSGVNTGTSNVTVTVEFTARIADDATGTGAECDNPRVFRVEYTIEPTPEGMLVDEPMGDLDEETETICSGASPATTYDVTVPNPATTTDSFQVLTITLNGAMRTGPAAGYLRADNEAVDTSSLVNTTAASINVVYTVAAVSAGPDEMFNTGDDCVGAISTLTVTVEPQIVSPPSDSIVRCFNVAQLNTYTLPAIAGMSSAASNNTVEYLLVDTVEVRGTLLAAAGEITVGNDRFAADGNTSLDYTIANNNTRDTTIVIFRFVPDFGAGSVCTGDTFDLTLFQEPRPFIVAIDEDENGVNRSEEVCPGGTALSRIDVLSPVGGRYLITNVEVDNMGGANVTGNLEATQNDRSTWISQADSMVIDTSTLENNGTVTGQIRYTVRAYSYGPDEIDDKGSNDDCLGRRFIFRISVPAEPVLATGLDATVCSGEETGVILDEDMIDIETTVSTTEGLVISTTPPPFTIQLSEDAEVGGIGTISGELAGDFQDTDADEFLDLFADGILIGRIDGGAGMDCNVVPFSFNVTAGDLATITADNEVEFTYGIGLGVQSMLSGCLGAGDSISVEFTYDIEATFDIVSVLPAGLITGPDFPTNAVAALGDTIAMDTFRNLTDSNIVVIYSVSPRNGACLGETDTVEVTVQPEPATMDGAESICSGDALNFDLNTLVSNTGDDLNGVSFTYEITRVSGNVSEVSVGDTGADDGNDVLVEPSLTNTSLTTAAVITYTVTPTGGNGCVGDDFEVLVTVGTGPLFVLDNGGNNEICTGDTRRLTSQVVAGGTAPFTYTYELTAADSLDGATIAQAGNDSDADFFVPVGFPRNQVVVSLTVTDANGCSNTATSAFTVIETPQFAAGEPMDLEQCEGTLGSGTAVFDLNDAVMSRGADTIITFYTVASDAAAQTGEIMNPTTYTGSDDEDIFVNIAVANTVCFSTASFLLNVNPLPMVSLDPINDVCNDEAAVTFTTNFDGMTFTGTTSFSASPVLNIVDNNDGTATFDPTGVTAGAYTVTFTYTDDNGCVNSADQIFNVLETPTADITSSADSDNNVICAGDMVTLTASGMGTYSWSTGATTASITVAPEMTTTYSVTVTSTNGCFDDASQTITVNPLPVVEIVAPTADGTFFCSTDPAVTLTNNAPTGFTGVFTNEAGMTITTFDPSAGNGEFDIIFTVTDDATGCVAADTATLTVNDAPEAGEPTADFESTDDDIDFCLSTSPLDLATFLMGADAGGTFSIETDPSGSAQVVNGTLDVSNVQTNDAQIEIVARYDVAAIGNCEADSAFIYINFEAVPFAGTQPGLAYLCEDYGEFGLDQLLVDATPGGTWTVISNNVGITLIGDDNDSIDTRDVVFLFQGQTDPESRTVQFRYTVQPTGNTACAPDFVDAFIQINLAPTITLAESDAVMDQVCFDETAINLTGMVGGSASNGSWSVVPGTGAGLIQNFSSFDGTDSVFTATYTPAMADRGNVVRFEFATNDPDGPAMDPNGLGFPFIQNPCEPERDTVDVLVFGTPVVTATPGDETICNESAPTSVLTQDAAPQPIFFSVLAVASDDDVTGFAANQPRLVDLDDLDAGMIINPTDSEQTVTYTITPYDDGPDEMQNSGDECMGTTITVIVTVEPTPQLTVTTTVDGMAQDALGPNEASTTATYAVCSGTDVMFDLAEFATSTDGELYVEIDIVDPDGVSNNGTDATGTFTLPLAAAQAIYGAGSTSFTNLGMTTATGVFTFTSYIETNPVSGAMRDADECAGESIVITFEVDPIPSIEGTVEGVVVNAANPGQVITVCDEDDNVDFAITMNSTDPDQTLLSVNITATNLMIVPMDATPDNVSEVLTITAANGLLSQINDWRLIDATTNGTATVTVTPVFDRNNDGVIDADECEGEEITFTVDVNPTPVADPIADMTFCAGQIVPEMPLTSNITSTTGTVTYDFAVSQFNIGLTGNSGVTSIPQFTATNASTVPVTGLVVVTPIFTEAGVSCTGDPITYSITVNPVPVVDGTVNGTAFDAASNNTLVQVCDTDMNVTFGTFNTNTVEANTFLVIETTLTNVAGGIGNATVSADMADGMLNGMDDYRLVDNTTNGTVQIRITPFFDSDADGDITDGECGGETVIIDIDVISTPAIMDIAETACSDEPIGIMIPTTDDNGLLLTSVTIAATVDASLTGTATTGTFMGTDIAGAIAADEFTNTTGGDLEVEYTVTPNTADCPGDDFTITVTINSEPILSTMLDTTVCSDVALGQTLEVAAGSASADSFRIVDIVLSGNVTANMGNDAIGAIVMADGLEDDSFNNISDVSGTATYTISPIGACEGDEVTVVFTINPEAIVTTADATVCSDEPSMLILTVDGTAAALDSFDITVDVPMGLIPAGTNFADGGTTDINAIAADTFNNVSGGDLDVTYTITPVSADGCAGDPVDVVLTVESEPFAPDVELFACSGEEFEFDIQDFVDDSGNAVASSYSFIFENISNFALVNNEDGDINGMQTYVDDGTVYTDNVINTTFFNAFNAVGISRFTITPTAQPGQTCGGNSFTVTVNVTESILAASIDVGGSNDVCAGETKVLQGSGSNGMAPYDFNWSIASQDATITSAMVTERSSNGGQIADFVATGFGQVVVEYFIFDDNGCRSEAQQTTLDVSETPAMVVIDGPTSVCTGTVQTFSVMNPQSGVSFNWSVNQGGTITQGQGTDEITVNFANAAAGVTSTISVVAGSGQCTSTSTLDVVTEEVIADFTFVSNETTVEFTNTSTASGTPTYEYTFGDPAASSDTDENPTFTYPSSGLYEVCLTVTSGGCVDMVCQDVFVSDCDLIDLATGFNIISTDVVPVDDQVSSVFSQQITDNEIAFVQGRDQNGNVTTFSPFLPASLNSLQRIEPGQGYIVFTGASSVLEVCGSPIDTAFRPALNTGINLVAFVPQTAQSIDEYFGDLYPGNLTLARGYDNGMFDVFNPFLPASLNTLDSVRNGFGYELTLTQAVGQGGWFSPVGPAVSREALTATSTYVVIAASTDLDDSYVGREALVTDADGNVFAFMDIIEGGYLMTTPVYANAFNEALDMGTELFVQVDDARVALGETFTGDSRLIYTDLTFNLTGTEVTEEGNAIELNMSPNPFREQAQISLNLEEGASVTVTVTDFTGRTVAELAKDKQMFPGANTLSLNGSTLASGTYLIHVVVDGVPLFHEQLIRIQ